MDTMLQGLTISGLGLAITFAALALLILAILVLERMFPARVAALDERAVQGAPGAGAADSDEEAAIAAAVAAAVAAALDSARSGRRAQGALGAALEAGHGRWWQPGYVFPVDGAFRGRQGS